MAKIALAFALLTQPAQPVIVTHYGTGDGLLGQHHGAYWHGDSCGLPDAVDPEGYGVAAPRWIPYCTKLLVCHEDVCITVTVVDRQRDDAIDGKAHLDLWPAAAQALGMMEKGIVEGEAWIP